MTKTTWWTTHTWANIWLTLESTSHKWKRWLDVLPELEGGREGSWHIVPMRDRLGCGLHKTRVKDRTYCRMCFWTAPPCVHAIPVRITGLSYHILCVVHCMRFVSSIQTDKTMAELEIDINMRIREWDVIQVTQGPHIISVCLFVYFFVSLFLYSVFLRQ